MARKITLTFLIIESFSSPTGPLNPILSALGIKALLVKRRHVDTAIEGRFDGVTHGVSFQLSVIKRVSGEQLSVIKKVE